MKKKHNVEVFIYISFFLYVALYDEIWYHDRYELEIETDGRTYMPSILYWFFQFISHISISDARDNRIFGGICI